MQVIISAGWGGLVVGSEFKNDPDVLNLNSVSHSKLFPLVKVILHHGGIGTTHAALRSGTPSIIVPFIVDQPWWAHKLNKQNLGPKSLPRRRVKSKFVAKRITEALLYKENVVAISHKMKEDKGIEETLKVVKEYLAQKP